MLSSEFCYKNFLLSINNHVNLRNLKNVYDIVTLELRDSYL